MDPFYQEDCKHCKLCMIDAGCQVLFARLAESTVSIETKFGSSSSFFTYQSWQLESSLSMLKILLRNSVASPVVKPEAKVLSKL